MSAQEPGADTDAPLAVDGTVPSLVTETVAEDADWTAIILTLKVTETVTAVTDPPNGSSRISTGAKAVAYKPDPNYCNSPPGTTTDNFTYTISPGNATGDINMTVTCVNDAPTVSAPGGVQTVNQNATLTLTTISVGDIDVGAGKLTLTLSVTNGKLTLASTAGLSPLTGNGTANISAQGTLANLNAALNGLIYAPNNGYFGNDSLTIGINDQGNTGTGGAKSANASVSIQVNSLPPTVQNDTAETNQDAAVNITVLANDVANSGAMDPASVTIVSGPSHGSAIPQANGQIRYTPVSGYAGPDSLIYRACNTGAKCGTATVNITVNPLPPTVNDDNVETDEDTAKDIAVLANDVANSGSMNPNSVSLVNGSGPDHGSATIQASGAIRYTPDSNFNGGDSFDYRACNSAGLCDSATVNITVKPGNDGPKIDPIDDQTMIEGSTISVDVVVSDIDNTNLTVQATSANTSLIPNENLVVSGTGNTRTLQITARANQIGRARITATVSDGQKDASTEFNVDVTAPDLSVAIDDGGVSVRPGSVVRYVVDYANNAAIFTGNASGVFVLVTVPDHTRFDSDGSAAGWNCTNGGEAGGVCRLDIGQLDRGESDSANFALELDLAVPSTVAAITVEAEIDDDGQNGNDSDPGNNIDDDTTPIDRSVVLLATKQDLIDVSGGNDGIAGPGDRIIYKIALENDSVTTALATLFTDAPDANTTLEVGTVRASQGDITQGNTPGDDAVSIALGEIAPSEVVTVEFNVIINTPVPDGVTQVANQGTISGDNFPTIQTDDPDTPNVGDATATALGAIPVLNAAKRVGLHIDANQDGLASPGDTLAYTVTLRNRGAVKATEVIFSDTVDPNTKLVNGSVMVSDPGVDIVSGNGAGDTVVNIDVGTLNSEEVVTITFQAQINSNLPDNVLQVANQGIASSKEIPLFVTDNPDTPEPNDPTRTPVVTKPSLVALKSYTLTNDADGNGEPSPGDTIEYTINIRNDGTRASGIVFTDALATYVKLTRTTPEQPYVQTSRGTVVSGNNAEDTTVVVTIDELGTGDSANITFKVKIASTVPADLLFVENQGVISSAEVDDVLTDDPKTATQNDPTRTPITGRVSLDATMTARMIGDMDGSGGYSEGDIIIYTVTVRNSGNRAAPETRLDVQLDSRTELYSDANFPRPDLPILLGTIPAGNERLTGILARLVNLGESTQVANQFQVTFFDPDAGATKSIPTDDPSTTTPDDPTVIQIQPAIKDLFLPIVAR